MGGKKPFKLAEHGEWIRARLAEKPDITGRELLAELRDRKVEVSCYGVWHFLDRGGLSHKKTLQGWVDAKRLIFIDETWAKTNVTRLHGRCPAGQRLVAKVPHGHWKALTFVGGPRCDGIVAPCVFDQPINAISFLAWVVRFLVPTPRRGDVVVMDNLGSHKGPEPGKPNRRKRIGSEGRAQRSNPDMTVISLPERLCWLDDQRCRDQGPLRGAGASPRRTRATVVRGE